MQGETTGEENSQRILVVTDLKYSGSYGRENIKRCLTMQTRIQGAKLVCHGCKNKTVQLSRESLEWGRRRYLNALIFHGPGTNTSDTAFYFI